jgi:phosphatidate cytidylyltransferase
MALRQRLKTTFILMTTAALLALIIAFTDISGKIWPFLILTAISFAAGWEWLKACSYHFLSPILWAGWGFIGAGIWGFGKVFLAQGWQGWFIVVALAATADTAAYAVGSFLKGPKLCPAISPGKTWSGFLGALLSGICISASINHFFPHFFPKTSISFLLALCAQLGDLIESCFKTRLNIKDTGTFLPGHGGILDRIDSWLLTGFFYGLWL